MAACILDSNLDHVYIAFWQHDDYHRFAELLEIPEILNKTSYTKREKEILQDFEIKNQNPELVKCKIMKLSTDWIEHNSNQYLLYQWIVDQKLTEMLDNNSLSLELRMLLATQPETVKLFQSPQGYDTKRVDGNLNHFLADYAELKYQNIEDLEVITTENIFRLGKKAILDRNTEVLQSVIQNSDFLSPDDKLRLILYSAELGRIKYLDQTFYAFYRDEDFDYSVILELDLSQFILQRKQSVFNMINVDFSIEIYGMLLERNTDEYINLRAKDNDIYELQVKYLKLSVKEYLPYITISILQHKIRKVDRKTLDIIMPDIIKNDNIEVLRILKQRNSK